MKKILVLRTAPWPLVAKLVGLLGDREPSGAVFVLTQKGSAEGGKTLSNATVLESAGASIRFCDVRRAVENEGPFDAAWLAYSDSRGVDYFRYELLLYRSNVPEVHSFNINERAVRIPRNRLLVRCPLYNFLIFVRKPLETVLYGILYAAIPLLARFFYRRGDEPEQAVFVTHFGRHLPSARIRAYHFCEYFKRNGVKARVISMDDTFGINNEGTSPLEKAAANLKLVRELLRYPRAVFCVLKPDYHFLACERVRSVSGNRLVFDQDDWDFDHHVFGWVTENRIVNRLLRTADGVVVSSGALKREFERRGAKPFYVPTGPNTRTFFPKSSSQERNGTFVCAWVGMIWGDIILDNLYFLLECMERIENERVVLKIAAGGLYVELFRRKAEARLGNRVEVVKWLPPERVPDFINASDIGVIPLVREKDYNRAKSPTKLFEFMACGVPCVSSPVGEIPGIVEHGENGLLARNLESFVEGIRGLFENPGARMKMGIRARRTIEQRYSLDSCAGRYLRELRDNRLIEDLQIVSDTGGKDPGKENGK